MNEKDLADVGPLIVKALKEQESLMTQEPVRNSDHVADSTGYMRHPAFSAATLSAGVFTSSQVARPDDYARALQAKLRNDQQDAAKRRYINHVPSDWEWVQSGEKKKKGFFDKLEEGLF